MWPPSKPCLHCDRDRRECSTAPPSIDLRTYVAMCLDTIIIIAEQRDGTILVLPAFADFVVWEEHSRRTLLPVKQKIELQHTQG